MRTGGRNRFVGQDRRNLFRMLDRSSRVAGSRVVHHISMLPPARESRTRFVFVAGTTNALYYSDGTAWNAI